jgi:hypothetical protein
MNSADMLTKSVEKLDPKKRNCWLEGLNEEEPKSLMIEEKWTYKAMILVEKERTETTAGIRQFSNHNKLKRVTAKMFLLKDKFINVFKPERKTLNDYIKKAEAYLWTKEQENMTNANLERITKKLRSMGMNPQHSSEGIWIAKRRVGIHAEETFQPIIVNENSYLAQIYLKTPHDDLWYRSAATI